MIVDGRETLRVEVHDCSRPRRAARGAREPFCCPERGVQWDDSDVVEVEGGVQWDDSDVIEVVGGEGGVRGVFLAFSWNSTSLPLCPGLIAKTMPFWQWPVCWQ